MKNKKLLKNKIEEAERRTKQWARGINVEFPSVPGYVDPDHKRSFYGKNPEKEALGLIETGD